MNFQKRISLIGDMGVPNANGAWEKTYQGVMYRTGSRDTLAGLAQRFMGGKHQANDLWNMQSAETKARGFGPGTVLRVPAEMAAKAEALGFVGDQPGDVNDMMMGRLGDGTSEVVPGSDPAVHVQSSDHTIGIDTTQPDWWKNPLTNVWNAAWNTADAKLNPWWAKPLAVLMGAGLIVYLFPNQTIGLIHNTRRVGRAVAGSGGKRKRSKRRGRR